MGNSAQAVLSGTLCRIVPDSSGKFRIGRAVFGAALVGAFDDYYCDIRRVEVYAEMAGDAGWQRLRNGKYGGRIRGDGTVQGVVNEYAQRHIVQVALAAVQDVAVDVESAFVNILRAHVRGELRIEIPEDHSDILGGIDFLGCDFRFPFKWSAADEESKNA